MRNKNTVYLPIKSIKAIQDKSVASVIPDNNNTIKNNVAPELPNKRSTASPVSCPKIPPVPPGSSTPTLNTYKYNKAAAETIVPIVPTHCKTTTIVCCFCLTRLTNRYPCQQIISGNRYEHNPKKLSMKSAIQAPRTPPALLILCTVPL